MLLGRRDWVYLLSLLVPLFVYNLSLKASSVASIPGLSPTFDLMRSDLFFNLGYALFWVGLFAAVHSGGTLRRIVVVLLHVGLTHGHADPHGELLLGATVSLDGGNVGDA